MMLWPRVLPIFIKTFLITSPVLMVHVTCAIIIDGSKVLVTQRSEAMKRPLKWEFPGGKVNLNESAETCIKRELIEELNIEVELLERLNDSHLNIQHSRLISSLLLQG